MKRALTYFRTIYRNSNNIIDLPRFLTFILTFNCNARCIMCDSWKKESKNELSFTEIESIFKQLPKMDTIRFSGGEPFVRKDILEISNSAQKLLNPFMMHITTNGFLTERIIEFCNKREKKKPLLMLVSIDGMKQTHNKIRGQDNAWEKVNNTLAELVKYQKLFNLSIRVNQTIVDNEGLEEYFKLKKYLNKYNVRNNVVIAYNESATYNINEISQFENYNDSDFDTYGNFNKEKLFIFIRKLKNDINNYPIADRIIKNYYTEGIYNRLINYYGSPNPKCVALNSHLRILPDGNIPTCQFNTYPIGNLKDQTFNELWYNDKSNNMRNWVKNCKGCWAECEVIPNAIFTGDIFKNLFKNSIYNSI